MPAENAASHEALPNDEPLKASNSRLQTPEKPAKAEAAVHDTISQHGPCLSPAGRGRVVDSDDNDAKDAPKTGDGGKSQGETSISTTFLDTKMTANTPEAAPAESQRLPYSRKPTTLNIDTQLKETEHERVARNHQYDNILHARMRLQERMSIVKPLSPPPLTLPSEGESFPNNINHYGLNAPAAQDSEFCENEDIQVCEDNGAAFEEAKKAFEEKLNPTWEDKFIFRKVEISEHRRLKRLKIRQDRDDSEAALPNRNELFCSEDETPQLSPIEDHVPDNSPPEPDSPHRKSAKAPKNTQRKGRSIISGHEKRSCGRLWFKSYKDNANKEKARGIRKQGANSRKRTKKNKARNLNFGSLFGSRIIANAKANSSKPSIPTFSSKSKDKALRELIASIPAAHQGEAQTDKQAILEAITKFGRRPRADGEGGWRFHGMATSLFHHQLLGAAFMRDRENSDAPPFGGFLCDEMGFGKTIQAIVNMIDGSATADEPDKTTLIVVPSHLVSNWTSQILQHCKGDALEFICHHAGNRPITNDTASLLQKYSVVITTYSEVRRSYPAFTVPESVIREDEKRAWWAAYFDRECGPLHRIKFRRIILDEAHEIKNHESHTSIAVRRLKARFRWVISGTPVQNYLSEFFPYFDFLQVPYTGDYDRFCRNYCMANGDMSRLTNVLRATMLRRTHEETLFGLPILKLPGIDEKTIEVKFNEAERFLYQQVTSSFLQRIGILPLKGNEKPACRWTMLLRLRMFTSHLLLAQTELKKILTSDVMDKLRSATTIGKNPTDLNAITYNWLEAILANEDLPSVDDILGDPIQRGDDAGNYDLIAEFRRRLNSCWTSGLPDEVANILQCQGCSSFVTAAHITSCMHLYCEGCFQPIQEEQSEFTCVCGATIQETVFCGSIDSPESEAEANHVRGDRQLPKENMHIKNKSASNARSDSKKMDEMEDDVDWVTAAGHLVPGAKLTAIRSCVSAWFRDSSETKVIIFTQFLDMVRILSCMCIKEGWGFTTLTGRASYASRQDEIKQFRVNPATRVMIASLKAGGTGLNLTMANKCILVDLWWNEAVEQQAFCRLFRIGQTRDVEIVRIVVRNTIDDRLQLIKGRKTVNIERVMGSEVLSERDSIQDLLKIFGVVQDDEAEGGFIFLSDDEGGQ